MSTQSKSRAPLFGLVALATLLLVGGGLYSLFRPAPNPVLNPSPSGPNISQVGVLKAEASDTVVTLTWQPIQGATGYFVHRDGGRDPLNLKPITKTLYQDIGLSNGRTYTYTVAPVIGGAEGKRLPLIKVTPNSR